MKYKVGDYVAIFNGDGRIGSLVRVTSADILNGNYGGDFGYWCTDVENKRGWFGNKWNTRLLTTSEILEGKLLGKL